MATFVHLEDKQREILFEKIKNKISNSSWEKFYPDYNISRASFFNYYLGKKDIPLDLFKSLMGFGGITLKNVQKIEKERHLKKQIPNIILDEKLAEIIGILNGDGHICPINYEICVVGDSKELDYLKYLKNLFERKFHLKTQTMIDKSKFKIRVYSKELFKLLTEKYGLPSGNKIGKLKIPIKIKKSKSLLIAYVRGLYDTDGTFYIRRKKDIALEISSADNHFLMEIFKTLKKLGFNVRKYKKHVNLYCKKDIITFFKIVKPANNKHLKKFNFYNNHDAGVA